MDNNTQMIEIASYAAYRSNRFGRPWAAKVNLRNGQLDYDFTRGTWAGTADEGGDLYVSATCGEVIAFGQSAVRNRDKSKTEYGIVGDDHSIQWITRNAAVKYLICGERPKVKAEKPKDAIDELVKATTHLN